MYYTHTCIFSVRISNCIIIFLSMCYTNYQLLASHMSLRNFHFKVCDSGGLISKWHWKFRNDLRFAKVGSLYEYAISIADLFMTFLRLTQEHYIIEWIYSIKPVKLFKTGNVHMHYGPTSTYHFVLDINYS